MWFFPFNFKQRIWKLRDFVKIILFPAFFKWQRFYVKELSAFTRFRSKNLSSPGIPLSFVPFSLLPRWYDEAANGKKKRRPPFERLPDSGNGSIFDPLPSAIMFFIAPNRPKRSIFFGGIRQWKKLKTFWEHSSGSAEYSINNDAADAVEECPRKCWEALSRWPETHNKTLANSSAFSLRQLIRRSNDAEEITYIKRVAEPLDIWLSENVSKSWLFQKKIN